MKGRGRALGEMTGARGRYSLCSRQKQGFHSIWTFFIQESQEIRRKVSETLVQCCNSRTSNLFTSLLESLRLLFRGQGVPIQIRKGIKISRIFSWPDEMKVNETCFQFFQSGRRRWPGGKAGSEGGEKATSQQRLFQAWQLQTEEGTVHPVHKKSLQKVWVESDKTQKFRWHKRRSELLTRTSARTFRRKRKIWLFLRTSFPWFVVSSFSVDERQSYQVDASVCVCVVQ